MVYPEIAKYMACKRMSQKDMAKIIGVSQQAASKKLNGITDFKRTEMVALIECFKNIESNLTMDQLFKIF